MSKAENDKPQRKKEGSAATCSYPKAAELPPKADTKELEKKLVFDGQDIVVLGKPAELLVGGKNYNTALISQIEHVRTPQFRAVSSLAFHRLLDETKVNAALIRSSVDKEYDRINWSDAEINKDPEFLRHFVRRLAAKIQSEQQSKESQVKLRTFINNVVEGFATSPEGIDQLRKRSVLVQVAILSVTLPTDVEEAVRQAYRDICKEAGLENVPVAVRSSAAGEDSHKKAFAGLQDTYLNIVGEQAVAVAYHWDCASAYNLRSMTYRREAILDMVALAESTGDESLVEAAKKEWAIENTSLSVCIMRMINPVISGTAFSADTATGCRGTTRNDLVSIDASYGLGEAVVSGMVTPDKFFVFQRDDGEEVVLRFMGLKGKKIVYAEKAAGTVTVDVTPEEIIRWSLSLAQAEEVAQGVRQISKSYGGIIMDTEFCIDQWDRLWFVQARPETRWNEDLEKHPQTIFMRRLEVDHTALTGTAEVILEGTGASRGAGQGVLRFLRSALELNKIAKGDILAADRTDPDMVPGMRIASAILANAGGDTSHAAITSRELGIPAVIGVQRLETLQALDGQEVTVDGTSGKVYRGLLPLVEVGREIDISKLPATKTKIGLILADVNQALFLSRLRNVPDFEVGLLRAEFMLGNVGVHPLALEAYDNGQLQTMVDKKLQDLNAELTKLVSEQLARGTISLDLNLRQYVGIVTGLSKKIEVLTEKGRDKGTDQVLAIHRQLRELDLILNKHLEMASHKLGILKTSPDLREHVIAVMGFPEVSGAVVGQDEEKMQQRQIVEDRIREILVQIQDDPVVTDLIFRINKMRTEVAMRSSLEQEREEVRTLPERIRALIRSKGYRSGKEHYIQTLAQGLALFAMAFYGKEIIYRTTDYKTNEYRNLMGGLLFEAHEDNPMLGFRGVSRNIHDWEVDAFKLARGVLGGKNLHLMLPFVRTLEEARGMRYYLEGVHGLKSGEDGLKIILMSEIPSNAVLAKQFIQKFDGFSIGSNDMTQLILGTDRDNARLRHIYDEEDPAVVWAILSTIFSGQKLGKKVGFCGQGVSNSKIIRGLVCIAGIMSASVVPDTYAQTKQDMAELEAENVSLEKLGVWLKEQHMERLKKLMVRNKYEHILKKNRSAKDLLDWFEGEMLRLHEQLYENIGKPREDFYRQEILDFRKIFHKPVIYANWDWEETVFDALRHSGFASYVEQAAALRLQQEKLGLL
jgi:pyruvate,water dikinase